jgi:hypothetical protein
MSYLNDAAAAVESSFATTFLKQQYDISGGDAVKIQRQKELTSS